MDRFPAGRALLAWALLLASGGLWARPAAGALVINEFLADPAGADAGGEFVELLNTGPDAVDLQGVALEFANGSVGPVWQARWQATASHTLAAGEFFLIVDRNWSTTGSYDAQVPLGLQNGPDAIRLARDGNGLDMVGYGNLTDPLMLEGQAVPLPTGLGLGRRPDGHDTDNNAADFQPVEITPGWRNFPDHAMELVSAVWDPPCARVSGQNLRLDLTLRNTGLLDLPPTVLRLSWLPAQGEALNALETAFAGCRSDEEWSARLSCPGPPEGRYRVRLELLASSALPGLTLDLGGMQAGPANLVLNEVLHLPGSGQGEWLELRAREDLNTGGMRWRDEDGDWRPLPEQTLLAGQRLLVAQDSTALLLWAEELGSLGIPMACEEADPFQRLRSAVGGWPNLNNSPPEGREFTDRILLADSLAVVIDQVVLPADGEGGIERGLAWERSRPGDGAVWRACLAPAGSTPGCANSVAAFGTLPARLTVRPAVLERSSASPWAHFLFTASPEAAAWHLEVYDLWGERVRDLGGGAVSGAEGDLLWDGRCDDGREVPPGAYIVVLLLSHGDGGLQPADRALVVVR